MRVVWHSGTGTFMALDECEIVDVPDWVVDVEDWLMNREAAK